MFDINISNFKINILAFITIFISLYFISFLIDEHFTIVISNIGNSYFEKAINKNPSLNRNVKIQNTEDRPLDAQVQIIYYDKKDENGNFIVKTIGTDLRREALLGFVFLTALIFSFPFGFKNNIVKFLIGLIILYLFLFFKLYVFVFDNFNYPEYALMQLPPITSFIVYWTTYFFNVVGSNTNVMIPVLIWFSLNIKNWISNSDK